MPKLKTHRPVKYMDLTAIEYMLKRMKPYNTLFRLVTVSGAHIVAAFVDYDSDDKVLRYANAHIALLYGIKNVPNKKVALHRIKFIKQI